MKHHFSILAWKILWTEEPGGLQSLVFFLYIYIYTHTHTHTSIEWSSLSYTVLVNYFIYSSVCNCTFLQDRNRVTNVENKLMVTRGKNGEG